MDRLTPKQLHDAGESHAIQLLKARGYKAVKLEVKEPPYHIRASKNGVEFFISVRVARNRQHVRLTSRRSVLDLEEGNFIFAFMPSEKVNEITELKPDQYRLLILPAKMAREDALPIHDRYWDEKNKDNNFSVIVKGYGRNHGKIWPRWLKHTDAWRLLP